MIIDMIGAQKEYDEKADESLQDLKEVRAVFLLGVAEEGVRCVCATCCCHGIQRVDQPASLKSL